MLLPLMPYSIAKMASIHPGHTQIHTFYRSVLHWPPSPPSPLVHSFRLRFTVWIVLFCSIFCVHTMSLTMCHGWTFIIYHFVYIVLLSLSSFWQTHTYTHSREFFSWRTHLKSSFISCWCHSIDLVCAYASFIKIDSQCTQLYATFASMALSFYFRWYQHFFLLFVILFFGFFLFICYIDRSLCCNCNV